jgi:hypothetical protein
MPITDGYGGGPDYDRHRYEKINEQIKGGSLEKSEIERALKGLELFRQENLRKEREKNSKETTKERFERIKEELYGQDEWRKQRDDQQRELTEKQREHERQLLDLFDEQKKRTEEEDSKPKGKNLFVPAELLGIIETILEDAGLDTKPLLNGGPNVEVVYNPDEDDAQKYEGGSDGPEPPKNEIRIELKDGGIKLNLEKIQKNMIFQLQQQDPYRQLDNQNDLLRKMRYGY